MSILTLLRKCQRAFSSWLLRLWGLSLPPEDLVSQLRKPDAFADTEGIHISFDGKPIAQMVEFKTQRFPGKEPDGEALDLLNEIRRDLFTNLGFYHVPCDIDTEQLLSDRPPGYNEPCEHPNCRSVGMPSEIVVPDTFPEDWRRE